MVSTSMDLAQHCYDSLLNKNSEWGMKVFLQKCTFRRHLTWIGVYYDSTVMSIDALQEAADLCDH